MNRVKQIFRPLTAFISATTLTASLSAQFAAAGSVCQQDAKPFVSLNLSDGRIIDANNERAIIQPGSMAKMMSELVIHDAVKDGLINPDKRLKISDDSIKKGRKNGGVYCSKFASEPHIENAIALIAVRSCNDYVVALAKDVAFARGARVPNAQQEAAFVELMNKKAAEIGMNNTHFMNSTGLPDTKATTTLADLAILLKYINDTQPELREILGQPVFNKGGVYGQTTLTLMRNPEFKDHDIFGKTAYVNAIRFGWAVSISDDTSTNIGVVTACHESAPARERATIAYYRQAYETVKQPNPTPTEAAYLDWKKPDLQLAQDLF